MRRAIVGMTMAAMTMGIGIPVVVSAADPPRMGLTLAPVRVFVEGPGRIGPLYIYDAGTEPEHVTISSSDGWLRVSESGFDLTPGQRREVFAEPLVPVAKDAGDHTSQVVFSTELVSTGSLRSAIAVAADVVFGPYGIVNHGLQIGPLQLPRVADSWDQPVVRVTLANKGNVHELVKLPPFGETLLLRGQRRVLALTWASHPFVGPGTVTVGSESASTVFVPWKGLALVLLLVLVVLLVRLAHRRRS
jgi:hypothetical protein